MRKLEPDYRSPITYLQGIDMPRHHTSIEATKPNMDSTGATPVRKGSIIEYVGGYTATVTKVAKGRFSTSATHHYSITPCSQVRVIGHKGNQNA
jgi:hypothetical protein